MVKWRRERPRANNGVEVAECIFALDGQSIVNRIKVNEVAIAGILVQSSSPHALV